MNVDIIHNTCTYYHQMLSFVPLSPKEDMGVAFARASFLTMGQVRAEDKCAAEVLKFATVSLEVMT